MISKIDPLNCRLLQRTEKDAFSFWLQPHLPVCAKAMKLNFHSVWIIIKDLRISFT